MDTATAVPTPPGTPFDNVEPQRHLPADAKAALWSACQLVLNHPGDYAYAVEWLNENYSEPVILERLLQDSERIYKSQIFGLWKGHDRCETFPRRKALRAARPEMAVSRRLQLLQEFYSVEELFHIKPEFIVDLSNHPEKVRDWVVQLTIRTANGRGWRIEGEKIATRNAGNETNLVNAGNVEIVWRWLDEQSRQSIRRIREERAERDVERYQQATDRGRRLRQAVQEAMIAGLPAGKDERAYAQRVALLACLLSYQHKLPLPGEFCSWQWENEGSLLAESFPHLGKKPFVPGRESVMFNPMCAGKIAQIGLVRLVDFDEFAGLVGRAVRIIGPVGGKETFPLIVPKWQAATATVDARAEWLAKAMLLVQRLPELSDAEIARRVGKNPGTLSRSTEYKVAAALARGSKADLPQGHVKTDSESGLHDVEALAPAAPSSDEKRDRGQRIPGSKYIREYCEECEDPIKVTPDKVGTKPLCDRCAK